MEVIGWVPAKELGSRKRISRAERKARSMLALLVVSSKEKTFLY